MHSFVEFIVKILLVDLPQSLVLIFGFYTFNKEKIEVKKFLIFTLLGFACISIARFLPISFGVHTLLSLIVLMLIGVKYAKFPIQKIVKAALLVTILLLIIEIINVQVLVCIFGEAGKTRIMEDEIQKAIAGIPNNIILFIGILIYYCFSHKSSKKENENETIGLEDSK